jgi:hypothetical protein
MNRATANFLCIQLPTDDIMTLLYEGIDSG